MEEKYPLISIIVPVYNVEKYLDRCLNSIVNQTYKNLEIILVDDGSPDNCPSMCDEWAKKDSRIKVIHQKNSGVSIARNVGIKESNGDFVGFVDPDDWIERDMYEYLYNLLRDSDADYSAIEMKITKEYRINIEQPSEKISVLNSDELFKVFFRVSSKELKYCVCDKLFRSKIVRAVDFWENMRFEDIYYNFETLKICKKAVYSNQIKYYWFFNSDGLTNNSVRAVDLQVLQVWDRIVKCCEEEYPQYLYFAQMNRKRANMAILGKYVKYGVSKNYKNWNEDKEKLVKSLRNSFVSLMKWNLPVSRKLLLIGLVTNVDVLAKMIKGKI